MFQGICPMSRTDTVFRKIFGKVRKRQENKEGCSGDHDGFVTSQGLTIVFKVRKVR